MDPRQLRYGKLGTRPSLSLIIYNEIMAFWQNKNILLSMTTGPILYVLFTVVGLGALAGEVSYHGQTLSYATYVVTGCLCSFTEGQMAQATYRSTVDKQYGLLALKLTNGVRPLEYIIGMSTFPLLGYLYQGLILWALGLLTGSLADAPLFGLAIVAGVPLVLFWAAIGIMVSLLFKNYQQRDLFMSLVFTPITYAAPLLYLLDQVPPYIQFFAYINPLTYQLAYIREVALGNFQLGSFLFAIALTVLCVALAVTLINRMQLTLQER